jgi:hypothetical protein
MGFRSLHNLTNAVRAPALAAFVFLSACASPPAEAKFKCVPVTEVFARSIEDGFFPLLAGVTDRGVEAQTWLDPKTGRWRVIGVDADGCGFLILQGRGLYAMKEPEA